MKWLEYFARAASVTSILLAKMPAIMADGKVSVDELVDLIKAVCGACGWSVEMEIPSELTGKFVGMKVK